MSVLVRAAVLLMTKYLQLHQQEVVVQQVAVMTGIRLISSNAIVAMMITTIVGEMMVMVTRTMRVVAVAAIIMTMAKEETIIIPLEKNQILAE